MATFLLSKNYTPEDIMSFNDRSTSSFGDESSDEDNSDMFQERDSSLRRTTYQEQAIHSSMEMLKQKIEMANKSNNLLAGGFVGNKSPSPRLNRLHKDG